jgi:hypothetical protein
MREELHSIRYRPKDLVVSLSALSAERKKINSLCGLGACAVNNGFAAQQASFWPSRTA